MLYMYGVTVGRDNNEDDQQWESSFRVHLAFAGSFN